MCNVNNKAHKEFMKFLDWLSTKEYYEQIVYEYMNFEGEVK